MTIMPCMKALGYAIAVGALAATAGCSRPAPAEKPSAQGTYTGAATHGYLLLVGEVRSQMNADNRDRIPTLICGTNPAMLDNQASRIATLKRSLAGFQTAGVDPDAVQFAQDIGAILDAYQAVCLDSAELYREVAHQDEVIQGESPRMPAIKIAMRAPQVDTLGAVAALVDAMARVGETKKPGYMTSAAIVQKLRDDREKLLAAKETHHLFTVRIKADFEKRYPSQDWKAKEILP